MKKLLIALSIVTTLTSCSEKVQTVDYYMDNPSALDTTLLNCSKMSENDRDQNHNCVNAKIATLRGEAKKDAALMDIKAIIDSLKMYKLHNGNYPTEEQGLSALVNKPTILPIPRNYTPGGYLEKLPKDPWGNEYQYQNPGKHNQIDVYSFGVNGSTPQGESGTSIIGDWE